MKDLMWVFVGWHPFVPSRIYKALAVLYDYESNHDLFVALQEGAGYLKHDGFCLSMRTMAAYWTCSLGKLTSGSEG